MTIYGIADLHLDYKKEKPMDVFGRKWENHEEKIFKHWESVVKEDDVVLIPGDISWALKLDDAYFDLEKLDKLPGIKVLSRGNHDYWWGTKSKLNSLNLNTLYFLNNDSITFDNITICGTRGWIAKDSDEFKQKDIKIFERELIRLKLSLESVKNKINDIIVMIHYPPFNLDGTPNEFVDVMKGFNVKKCVYGHLHAEGHKYATEGIYEGIEFNCISCDYIDFKLKKIL